MNGETVRINLKPFKMFFNKPERLLKVMLNSIGNNRNFNEFIELWREFINLVIQKKLDFNFNEVADFNEKMKKENYPVVSHSEAYK
ncbi:hypothetical protein DRQ09_10245, partial [candidate division KSB1 bacterium]